MDTSNAVQAEELRKTYGRRVGAKGGADEPGAAGPSGRGGKSDGVRALDGLSFSIPAGSVFALLGPNGAGKTTAVRILTTLSRPDSGRAQVAGIDVLKRPGQVRSVIGAVSQRSGAVNDLTGYENLALQGKIYRMRGDDLRHRVVELLEQFGLTEAARRQVRTYSGGMRRRLDVATALVHRPDAVGHYHRDRLGHRGWLSRRRGRHRGPDRDLGADRAGHGGSLQRARAAVRPA